MRLEARPTRTDANLGDTGTLRVEGSFQRADKIENTPMKVSFDWQRSQLGQLTTLIYGRDRGWRGTVGISGTLEGMPRQFAIKMKTQIDDFRRYDISSEDSVRLVADCVADHVTIPKADEFGFRNTLTCDIPTAPGNIEVRAYDQYWEQAPSYISVRANGVPFGMLAQLYRHAKRDVPRDLAGDGLLNGYFSRVIYPDNNAPRWIGQGTLTNVRLTSAALAQEVHASSVHFGFSHLEHTPEGPTFSGLTQRLSLAKNQRPLGDQPANIFTIDPFNADFGGNKLLTIGGTNSASGLQLQVKGDGEVKHLLAAAQLFGLELPALNLPPTGTAEVDYNISGRWAGFAAPVITGTARAAGHPAPPRPTETASNQQHAKTTKQ
jgi:AsmA protein